MPDPVDILRSPRKPKVRWLTAALSTAVACVLLWALGDVADAPQTGLGLIVAQHIGDSGVTHPVTAVLLNFRAYDTWLELAVLLTALMAVLAVHRRDDLSHVPIGQRGGPMISALVRRIVPLMVLVSGYLLWRGAHGPGGAFQAGAVLAAGGVLIWLAGLRVPMPKWAGTHLRTLAALGVALFTLVAVATAMGGRALIDYPPRWAGELIFAIEIAATASIALTLVMLFVGAQRVRRR